ncbi:hypothetical protein [Confluentibacter flavum]|uniref:Uncharacterized protein n=1 Tax=Confluentibacter flavum TaxID=1909700 RepID=A0A2N3HJW8_9FLAO|nr:hypothetical protein [Confluentibacter flavum]PKQ45184.1 hypothetical protein CSW08_09200 [Confluentibacter flavum]
MDKLEITGGARIGMANATWPFATLKVSKDKLELNASIAGNLVFQPKDIISIETYTQIPLLGQGIKINHRIANYNRKVIFWTFKDPSTLVNQIKQTGFFENIDGKISDNDTLVIKQQQAGGFPIKKSVAIGVIVLLNLLLLSDFINFSASDKKVMPLGNGATIALATLFLISILSLISKDFSKLILKEGKSLKDIDKFLYLLVFISGFMLIGILTFKNV